MTEETMKHTVAQALGEIVWLLSQSPVYKHLQIADLEWMVMPPMLLNQFRIFRSGNQPLGFALWAYLSEEVEARLVEHNKKQERFELKPAEWKSGDRLWLVELVCPFHTEENKLNEIFVTDLVKSVFAEKKFKFLQHSAEEKQRDIKEWGA